MMRFDETFWSYFLFIMARGSRTRQQQHFAENCGVPRLFYGSLVVRVFSLLTMDLVYTTQGRKQANWPSWLGLFVAVVVLKLSSQKYKLRLENFFIVIQKSLFQPGPRTQSVNCFVFNQLKRNIRCDSKKSVKIPTKILFNKKLSNLVQTLTFFG